MSDEQSQATPIKDTNGPVQPTAGLRRYRDAIKQYDTTFQKWVTRSDKIIRIYRDDDRPQTNSDTAKFNILWSNVQTLIPAVYARLPKADVSRRFGDNDQIGRVASLLLERALDFEVEHYPDFRATMKSAVQDRFLGGRGQAWVRYEPHNRAQQGEPPDGVAVTEDVDQDDVPETAKPEEAPEEVKEEIDYECAPVDYVNWKDFGHSVARTWEEVTLVWRWVYMEKPALIARFGEEKAKLIPTDTAPKGSTEMIDQQEQKNKARVCELWDKEAGRVFWFTQESTDFIDEVEDPYGLEGFFPCPPPLYATLTNDSLVPVPDFALYQDQASELNILSDRIDGLVKALKVRGVYDASVPALQRLMTEGDNNTLIPVDKWQAFSEKGGLKGAVDLLPLDMIAEALLQAYKARADIKSQIYEITGIADIIRGQTEASETATAQEIKGRYAGLRLKHMQEDVALFATGLLRLKAQLICTKFQPQTIVAYAAAQQMTPEDQAMVPQALQLLENRPLRNFRVDVAADSLVQIDEAEEKKGRMEFLEAFGGFMQQALPVVQSAPQLAGMVAELMKFGVGAFKGARQIEGALDQALSQLKQQQQAGAAQPKPPSEEQLKAQAEMQKAQMQAKAEQDKLAANLQIEAGKLQVERERIAAEMQIEREKIAAENERADREFRMKLAHDAEQAAADRAARAAAPIQKAA